MLRRHLYLNICHALISITPKVSGTQAFHQIYSVKTELVDTLPFIIKKGGCLCSILLEHM